MKSLAIVLVFAAICGVSYAGHDVTATATATAVAPAGNGSVGTVPMRSYRSANWGTVRLVRRVPVEAVTEQVVVPRRDRVRLRLVREERAPLVFERTRLQRVGGGSVGK